MCLIIQNGGELARFSQNISKIKRDLKKAFMTHLKVLLLPGLLASNVNQTVINSKQQTTCSYVTATVVVRHVGGQS